MRHDCSGVHTVLYHIQYIYMIRMSDVILYSIAIRFRLLYDTYVRTYPSTVQRVALALPLGQLRNAVATLALNCVYYGITIYCSSELSVCQCQPLRRQFYYRPPF